MRLGSGKESSSHREVQSSLLQQKQISEDIRHQDGIHVTLLVLSIECAKAKLKDDSEIRISPMAPLRPARLMWEEVVCNFSNRMGVVGTDKFVSSLLMA